MTRDQFLLLFGVGVIALAALWRAEMVAQRIGMPGIMRRPATVGGVV